LNTPSPSTGRPIASAIFGVLASSLSAVSAADSSSASITVNSASITVNYADLKITSPSGALVLYERIRTAAQSACNYFWFKTDVDEARCVHNAIANAVTKVNQPALSAIYDARFKKSAPGTLVSQSR
jgi:UrcA family protein